VQWLNISFNDKKCGPHLNVYLRLESDINVESQSCQQCQQRKKDQAKSVHGLNQTGNIKGIASRDFEVCFLVPLDSSDIATPDRTALFS
jgi:hypothetical protein